MIYQRYQNHLFWGSHAPLSTLAGAGLLVMASGRTAYALIALGSLVWVYGLTVLVYCFAKPVFPKRGIQLALVFLSTFFASLYLLLLTLTSPFLAMETTLIILLAPVSCISSEVVFRLESLDPDEGLARAALEALTLGGLIFALALIREPLGYGSLSLPGGRQGIIELFSGPDELFFPVRIIAAAAGALLLLGYGLAVFRYFRKLYTHTEENP
ncbi:MAG: hypothetical protein LBQ38_09125 [Spirochaetaceae bacterium]|jgi:hypothetical protein|nr:hypothetical protein [Spirochaetaceae bacterium]